MMSAEEIWLPKQSKNLTSYGTFKILFGGFIPCQFANLLPQCAFGLSLSVFSEI